MNRLLMIAALTLLAGFAVACAGDENESEPTLTPTVAASDSDGAGSTMLAGGPGLSIAEARTTTAEGPLLVNGFIVATADEARFCELLLESMPPQCGGDSLLLEGYDLAEHPELDRSGGVTWSANQLQLLGDVEGDTFVADMLSLASS